jgi:ankyrin repeat protein
MTALYAAACNGHLETVKYLYSEGGADVNICDNLGTSPCDAAYNNGHIDVARYLRESCGATAGTDYAAILSLESSVDNLKDEISTLKKELGAKQRRFLYVLLALIVVLVAFVNQISSSFHENTNWFVDTK